MDPSLHGYADIAWKNDWIPTVCKDAVATTFTNVSPEVDTIDLTLTQQFLVDTSPFYTAADVARICYPREIFSYTPADI